MADRFRLWLGGSEEVDEPGFSRSVAYAELIENAGNLDPRTYLRAESGPGGAADLGGMLADFERGNRETSELGAELAQIMRRTGSAGAGRRRIPEPDAEGGGGRRGGRKWAGPCGCSQALREAWSGPRTMWRPMGFPW